MNMNSKAARCAATALTLLCLVAGRALADPGTERSITVTGSGTAEDRPDRAEVNAAVISTGETAKATVDANTLSMTQVLTRLRDAGFDDQAIVTTHYDVSPQFQKAKRDALGPVITGYRVTSRIRVTVTDLARVGQVLDQMTAAGINQISGLRFVLSDRKNLVDKALRTAMVTARQKAEVAAAAAGVAVGPVVRIEERGTSLPQPRMMAFSERAGVPINPGEQSVRASVSVTYVLIDRD